MESIYVVGILGGLAFLWNPDIVTTQRIQLQSNRCISMRVSSLTDNFSFGYQTLCPK